jgi:hypothetical protein
MWFCQCFDSAWMGVRLPTPLAPHSLVNASPPPHPLLLPPGACREVFSAIRHLSREQGLATWQQLELNVFRTAAGFVLDLLRGQVGRRRKEYNTGVIEPPACNIITAAPSLNNGFNLQTSGLRLSCCSRVLSHCVLICGHMPVLAGACR